MTNVSARTDEDLVRATRLAPKEKLRTIQGEALLGAS